MANETDPKPHQALAMRMQEAQTKIARVLFHRRALDHGAPSAIDMMADFADGFDEMERILEELRPTRVSVEAYMQGLKAGSD